MFADIQPADVYQRVSEVRTVIAWIFGIWLLLTAASFAADVYFILQKRKINAKLTEQLAEQRRLTEQVQEQLERQKKANERLELWLTLLETHQDRGAEQKIQMAEHIKDIKEKLQLAPNKEQGTIKAVEKLTDAIHEVPKQVVNELKKDDSAFRYKNGDPNETTQE